MVRNVNVNVDLCSRLSCELVGWVTIAKYQALEIVYVQVVGEGKSGSWGGAQTKGEVRKCQLTKNMFFHSDLLQLCLKKNGR